MLVNKKRVDLQAIRRFNIEISVLLFEAYESWMNEEGSLMEEATEYLPGLEYLDGKQLFFVAFARSFCSSTNSKSFKIAG